MFGFTYWVWPVVSAVVWLATLLGLLLTWITDDRPHYPWMESGQRIAYISDVAADRLKPLFIAGCTVTVLTLTSAFVAERWARHSGKLYPNTSGVQKVLAIGAIVAAIVGAVGLILTAVLDTRRYSKTHNIMLGIFMGGYLLSAIFNCAEYQRLGVADRSHVILRASFWSKLAFILVELALCIAFGVTENYSKWNVSAVIEWLIGLIFTFYVLTLFLDFLPMVRRHHHPKKEGSALQMAENGTANPPHVQGGETWVGAEGRQPRSGYNF